MKNFKNLIVWQRSMELAGQTTKIVQKLPNEEKYTYRDQIVRSSISIPSNIAEGSSRNSRKDFKRFLQISLGSSFELETQLLLLEKNGILNESILKTAFSLNEEVQKMLQSLLKK
ncbi:four helix bundle protein [Gracilimonas tropica]|uniref:four helix bundle protein n=1 Tax=Gracilimonas tropica TaxID=454600 RepID=UPI0003666194|nr:four helix bundle protein [Gracilimonas tropica]